MNESSRPRAPGLAIFLLFACVILLYVPIADMISSSFGEGVTGRGAWSIRWYLELIQDTELWRALGRSLMVAIVTGVASTTLALICAVGLVKWKFFASRPLSFFAALSLTLPELVLALSALSWFSLLGLRLSLVTVACAHVTLTLPFAALVIGARLQSLDASYDEAARDLGASESGIFFRVTLPLLKPALLSAFILVFLISFDDFLVTFFTNGADGDTLPVRLYSLMKNGLTPKIQALSTCLFVASTLLAVLLVRLQSSGSGSDQKA